MSFFSRPVSRARSLTAFAVVLACLQACSDPDRDADADSDTGGQTGAGGADSNASGGNSSSGGAATQGDGGAATGTGGAEASTGGAITGAGGEIASGGTAASGGTTSSGGASESGGSTASGGAPVVIPVGPPFTVKSGLYDASKTTDLGLPTATGTETVTIFHPGTGTDHYSNGVVMIGFKGNLYAQWQSSATDEDAADTKVFYSRSKDGKSWPAPMTLAPAWNQGVVTSGGWWTDGQTLVAYVNVWPTATTPRGGYVEYTTSTDGTTWSARKRVLMDDGSPMNGIFEQDPHALPFGRILNAAHFQPGLVVAPIYSDDPLGVSGWKRAPFANLAHTGDTTREMEPSSFLREDGVIVMVFRDQASSYHRLASMSGDSGESWTAPVETNMPDSRQKQSAGNLPDGTAYQVGCPVENKTRVPLVVSLSETGKLFDKAFVLRKGGSNLQAQRYTGKAKTLGYNYPKSTVYDGYLYVAYATNKEDVEYTRVPLASLAY